MVSRQDLVSLGFHQMWGFSPSFNILQVYINENNKMNENENRIKNLNILLINPSDIRHIIHTIAQRHRSTTDNVSYNINFFIYEKNLELISRNLLFLKILFDFELTIRNRTNLFLEIYGNCKVQDRTSKYIAKTGKELIHLICDDPIVNNNNNNNNNIINYDLINLTKLKYRDRDYLENIFKSWQYNIPFEIDNLRDRRLRHHYGDRYDYRKNLIDYDYQNKIKPISSIIHYQHFKTWRLDGIAFEFGDQIYNTPNRTMASYAEGKMRAGRDRGIKKEVKGYWIDIINGPYHSLGLTCDLPNQYSKDLFKILNKGTGTEQHRHNAVEVSVYNILSFLYEIETGKRYIMAKEHDVYSGLGEKRISNQGIKKEKNDDENENNKEEDINDDKNDDETKNNDNDNENEEIKNDNDEEIKNDNDEEIKNDNNDEEIKIDNNDEEINNNNNNDIEEKLDENIEKSRLEQERSKIIARARHIIEALDGINITFLSGEFDSILNKSSYHSFFDHIFLSIHGAHYLNNDKLYNMLNENGSISVESSKYIIPISNENVQAYHEHIIKLADDNNFQLKRNLRLKVNDDEIDDRDKDYDISIFTKK